MKRLIRVLLFNSLGLMVIAGCSKPAPNEHIKVVMRKYEIDPGVIKVKSGDIVELEVSTADVQHGFEVAQLGIKEPVQPGKPAIFTFKAPAKGQYKITCGILCGPRHDDMQATLVVE